jgi:hypothetical protein
MNTMYQMYPDVARVEIDQRLRAATAGRPGRLVRHAIGFPRPIGRAMTRDGRVRR